jgi:very-short-patch-repair endonuclease
VSELEEIFAFQLRASKLPAPLRQYRFWEGRRFAFDFAWPEQFLAVEIDGGTYGAGAHNRHSGIVSAAIKRNEAQLRGWRVLVFTTDMVSDGVALAQTERAFKQPVEACDPPYHLPTCEGNCAATGSHPR